MGIRLRNILTIVRRTAGVDPTDADLIAQFRLDRSEEAFAEIVRRHGAMVFGVCRRMLSSWHDAEDAFQATFLVLACKPDAVRPAHRLAAWLHGVACHVALKARRTAARRLARETRAAVEVLRPTETVDPEQDNTREVIDEVLLGLPEKYRAAVVLCDLEGLSRKDAADRLGWSEGVLSGRLARARKLLAERLTCRGVTLGIGGIGVALSALAAPASVAGELTASTLTAAALVTGGLDSLPAGPAAALALGVARSMSHTRTKLVIAALIGAAIPAAGVGSLFAMSGPSHAPGDAGPAARPPIELVDTPARVAPKAAPGWKERHTLRHAEAVTALAFGPDAVAAGDKDGNVTLWDAQTGKERKKVLDAQNLPQASPIDWLGFSPDGGWLYMTNMDRSALHGCSLDPNKLAFPGFGGSGQITFFGLTPDADLYYHSAPGDKRVTFMKNRFPENIGGGGMIESYVTHEEVVVLAAASSAGGILATLTKDGAIHCWDYKNRKELWSVTPEKLEVTVLALAPGGQWLAVGGKDGSVRLFDTNAKMEIAKHAGHRQAVTSIAFDPDGKQIVSGGEDGRVVVAEVKTGKVLPSPKGHAGAVKCIAYSPDGNAIASGSVDRTVKVWEFKR